MKIEKTVRDFDSQDYEYMEEWSKFGYTQKLDELIGSIEILKQTVSNKKKLQGAEAKQYAYLQRVLFRDIQYYVKDLEKHLVEIEESGVWR